jgi:hypothetical protein
MSFISRKVFKKRNKQNIIQQLKRKLMTTKWILTEKINPDGTIKYKARCEMCLKRIHADPRS